MASSACAARLPIPKPPHPTPTDPPNLHAPPQPAPHPTPQVLEVLFEGYQEPAIALNCGSMFRDCIRDEGVAR
jgi:hypothetical protein